MNYPKNSVLFTQKTSVLGVSEKRTNCSINIHRKNVTRKLHIFFDSFLRKHNKIQKTIPNYILCSTK
ncbi:hypothetical protein BpHYR1_045795 [Brachionus plicatilis]|uniref:Uncharacterized protein n=1 Tax=Brachionus plicatilis TaxID=10195 RepID=A0A3M7P6E6_BRAPC|nr:hypothetical protein BpHYR1_045795 [Brachionus plicatilis]